MERKDIITMINKISENGHSPDTGCSTFSYGYEQYFEKLKKIYLNKRLSELGSSAEKFVIGQYGSGKTHFCRQILEIGDSLGFCTVEVQLNRNIDFTKPLIVFKEVASHIKIPGENRRGMRVVIASCYENIKSFFRKETGDKYDQFLRAWIDDIDSRDIELPSYSRVLKKALNSYAAGGPDNEIFINACRWLEGEVHERNILGQLGESRVASAEEALHGQRAMNSLYQFIRECKYPGTIAVFDEAEQSFQVDKAKLHKILSMLQSGINNIADLRNGAVLVLYALTLDIADHFNEFPALKQRLDDPIGGRSFFEGNIHAPKIILEYGHGLNPKEHLRGIGERLVDLYYGSKASEPAVSREDAKARIYELADEILITDASPSNRRAMAKAAAYVLVYLDDNDELPADLPKGQEEEEIE